MFTNAFDSLATALFSREFDFTLHCIQNKKHAILAVCGFLCLLDAIVFGFDSISTEALSEPIGWGKMEIS